MLFASLPCTKPMAAETRLRSRRGLRALAARAARRARSMQHLPLPAFALFVNFARALLRSVNAAGVRLYSASACVMWLSESLPQTRLLTPQGSNPLNERCSRNSGAL